MECWFLVGQEKTEISCIITDDDDDDDDGEDRIKPYLCINSVYICRNELKK